MDKAVEIKRRAQRCVQNGDLDGALSEYEKLVAAHDTDPYNYVLLADLLYKKGDQGGAADRYLTAAAAYESAGLYKNGIAVCKKMLRLSLAPARVLRQLAVLHASDGLGTEAALYYMQYAEHQVRAEQYGEAADALRKAFEASTENVKALERLAEVRLLEEDRPGAARVMAEAARQYGKTGQLQAAEQCKRRGREFDEMAFEEANREPEKTHSDRPAGEVPEPGVQDIDRFERKTGTVEAERDADLEVSPPRLNETADAGEHGAAELGDVDAAPGENGAEPDAVRTIESAWREASADPPGLQFGAVPATTATAPGSKLARVETLLAEAQEAFKSGDRVRAAETLALAAEAYEEVGQLDSAATIYRSLAKSAQAPEGILERWLENCQKRTDVSESAHVACELGDRAMAANRSEEARGWFEKAMAFEPGNGLATRRLQRLGGLPPAVSEAAAPSGTASPDEDTTESSASGADGAAATEEPVVAAETPAPTSGSESGRVEVAVGRGEAVTFDLGSLISEFQRGVEAQLSGDAQSHYDLGMAYREMGLLEQAVDSFRIAQKDVSFADRCSEMIGRSLLDQGRFEDAGAEFKAALDSGRLDLETEVNLRYQLGLAHEAAGRVQDALGEFEDVYAAQPNFPDVALKIRVLRKSLERG